MPLTTLPDDLKPAVEKARVDELFTYDPTEGVIRWRHDSKNGRAKAGEPAGSTTNKGYIQIFVDGTRYNAQRIAWLMVYGTLPALPVDHINGDRSDNRISNLRVVTNRQNHQNRRLHRAGKLPGCHFNVQKRKWTAQVHLDGKNTYLGIFNTEAEAHRAYKTALNLHAGEKVE